MGYYCTVPQCTSLAGKTKNVKFHRFPRDTTMADKWNVILKRGKPYTKYSKVCSLHFTQSDYNVTNMGQWKTLSKDAVPSQNLPKLNPDGTVMVIRKSRTLKYKDGKKEEPIDKTEKWSPLSALSHGAPETVEPDNSLAYRLQTLHALASAVAPATGTGTGTGKPRKQDAFMQTDPVHSEEEETSQPNNSYSETSDNSFHSEQLEYPVQYKEPEKYEAKSFEPPKDYTKSTEDYIPQTNEEYNKEAEKYALGRKSHNGYDKLEYQKPLEYQKMGDLYEFRSYTGYPNGYTDSAEILRNQQHNLQILQEQHRATENQNFFPEGHIKQEVDLNGEEEKFLYERTKDQLDAGMYAETQRRLVPPLPSQVKQEPEGCENVMQPQGSPYYSNGHDNVQGQNTMKRPFFYSENPHYNGPPLLHRFEDIPRILQ
ncbi:uncharacterized protein isoform X2 [Choristoneura fumiferana]|uniref:uncharacterized protein isoform X2 n=1 Tax=Choristoneura fumiferana TaxID=7141 RepID=UPI003D159418